MQKLSAFMFIIILLLSPLPSATKDVHASDLTVATDTLYLRQGPGLSYPIVDTLKRGTELQSVEQQGDWIQVKVNGQTGWVAVWLIKSTSSTTSTNQSVISQVNHLNLRAEASQSASVLTQLSSGAEAQFLKQQGDWVQVNYNEYTGWVASQYVTITSTSTTNQSTESSEPVASEANFFTVNVDAVNIRKKPDLDSKKAGVATRGTQYKIIGRENNWVQIQFNDDTAAWIYSFYGTFSDEGTNKESKNTKKSKSDHVTIIYDGTNIRETASTSANVVYRANAGETFSISNTDGDWYEVTLDNGNTGFIANWVVSTKDTQQSKKSTASNRKKGTLKGLTIVIDPGHGGVDHGTTGVRGTAEKDVNLATAELLTSKLRSAGADVILTRESDEYVDLRKRVSISHTYAADAFISIHYDATTDTSVKGFTAYYMNSNQKELAKYIHGGLENTISLRDRGVQPANYLVLRENKQPAVLLELGYLSNAGEENKINTDVYREQATLGIYKGLIKYFDAQLD